MSSHLERVRLEEILDEIHKVRVGVCGDFVLDGYWYADMTRAQLSRETPLYNRPVVSETYNPGGAANVAWNLADLGVGEVQAISVIGPDWRGGLLRGILRRLGVRTDHLLECPEWKTPFYGKVVLAGWEARQEDARLDMINASPLSASYEDLLIEHLQQALPQLDALIIADQIPLGIVTGRVGRALLELAERYPGVVFLADSRDRIERFQTMVIKPNEVEARQLFFPTQAPEAVDLDQIGKAAMRLNDRTRRPIYITLGKKGCLVCENQHVTAIPAVEIPPPIDTVGAGDAFMASLAAGLAARLTAYEAGCLANLAAAVTIQKIGMTGTASPQEILKIDQKWG